MRWAAVVEMDHQETGSPAGASMFGLHSWDHWTQSRLVVGGC